MSAKTGARKGERVPAESLPVARIVVDVPLAHLDRPFDYAVPSELDDTAVPGCRVRVRFAGQLVDGYLLERAEKSEYGKKLAFIEKVVSPEPVLAPEIAALARAIADRYAGGMIDVLRLAIPPRHARAEAAASPEPPPLPQVPAWVAKTAALDVAAEPDPAPGAEPSPTSGAVPATPHPATPPSTPGDAAPATLVSDTPGLAATPGLPAADDPAADVPAADVPAADVPAADVPAGDPVPLPAAALPVTPLTAPPRSHLPPVPADAWSRYPRGPKYLEALREGRPAHAVWQALPSEDWPARLAEAAAAVASSGRGVAIVVPDHRDLARVAEACGRLIEGVVTLSADLGPSERYKRWLAVRRGVARVVVGTRATAFAPVRDPGLLVVWDDGDDLHVEQRSPYPNVRDVLVQRAHMTGAALLIGGFARTAEAQLLVETGWAHEIVASRETLRSVAPRVVSVGDNEWQDVKDPAARTARLPSIAFDAARFALADSPVLIQVPRRGYVPSLACGQCRGPARCRRCAGPLALPGGTEDGLPKPAYCRWCAATEAAFRCPTCGSRKLRGQIIGARRTAEELGRAFPGHPVRTSGADEVLTKVPGKPALVVATPGAEPVAEGGYGAVLLLDGWALLGRADLRASEEALRRWMTAAGLVRPGNGRVVVIADSGLTPVQALVRWDPVWHAATELAARTELGFPPAVRMATVDGTPDAVNAMLDELRLPPTGEILGPVPLGDDETKERALVRVARAEGRQLAAVLAEAQAVRTARKEQELVRIKLDPLEVL
ncbi:primosome assembly protein PriA [Lentzea sp. HUAS12]|uniref:primosomal protein N' family DNA-binding protein n=1 Tax=Lentzea sp. HUAS12 TaxID=2951806 RepID=UPI00209EC19A|nr:primosome assembly protein PriA [Lentzea sp. HUAS12]USX55841.1 primosome assembly protein PriA [Lentzea sp. HUAS12]